MQFNSRELRMEKFIKENKWICIIFGVAILVSLFSNSKSNDFTSLQKTRLCKAYIGDLFNKPTSSIRKFKEEGDLIYVTYVRHSDKSEWFYVCDVSSKSMVWTGWLEDKRDWGRLREEDRVKLNVDKNAEKVTFIGPDTRNKVVVYL
tara:strand:- start:2084 stop:2524 length:441 start_codon:yes stop_codon:yes gene_type:complete